MDGPGKQGRSYLSKTLLNFLKLFSTAASGLLFVFASAQPRGDADYAAIFSGDYERAVRFLKEEKWIDELIISYHLNPKEVKAIVFPELIRYNATQDKIETFALESLYIQYGKDYADFSISEFQIKPSFAENVEVDFLKYFKENEVKPAWHPVPADTIQNQDNRAKRLKRIKDRKTMVNYICLFFIVMDAKYPRWKSDEAKIKFFASAYNCGYRKSKEEVVGFIPKKFFHTGVSVSSKRYCYSDITWYFIKKEK